MANRYQNQYSNQQWQNQDSNQGNQHQDTNQRNQYQDTDHGYQYQGTDQGNKYQGTNQELQTTSKWKWNPVRQLEGGSVNGGIRIVQGERNDVYHVEKKSTPTSFRRGEPSREIKINIQVSWPAHPYICQMVDYYYDSRIEEAGFYMEWCELGNLYSLIVNRKAARKPFEEKYVWLWFLQLFDALSYCHYGNDRLKPGDSQRTKGSWDMIWHRGKYLLFLTETTSNILSDIKLDNILVARGDGWGQGKNEGMIMKLTDFGMGTTLSHRANNQDMYYNKRCGAPAWDPPEGPIRTDTSDVWQVRQSLWPFSDTLLTTLSLAPL
jgi:serine/threonine protein kinase